MDFSIKQGPTAHRGLTMGLCPGLYQGKESFARSVFIREAAFGPLEPAIRENSAKYAMPYAHWGVTPISRAEWMPIIDAWHVEKIRLEQGGEFDEKTLWWFTQGCVPERSVVHRDADVRGLATLIVELSDWLRATLETYDQVTVLGI